MKVTYKHVRNPLNFSKYIATICLIEHEDGKVTHSFTQCKPGTPYNKEFGRRVAYNRALNDWRPDEIPFKLYNQDGTRRKIYPVTEEILKLLSTVKEKV